MPIQSLSQPPELLAPAGDFDCLRAAVENGADAVYFGLEQGFNARARAANFSCDNLPDVMSLLRRRGVKGYVTINTLVFSSELCAIEPIIARIAEAGVDAVLVQDLGLARLVRAICPDLELHASTQMTLTSAECINAAQTLGIRRVVLPRELSIDEIRQVRSGTDVPLEVFVHGALCVAYSGQCLTSESLGGRSANRGQCAQACRLPYELVCDGNDVDLNDVRYLLSPQDLAAYDLVPQLIEAGVCSFKIEGRLKSPEYVANITRHYRQAIDSAMAGRPVEFTPRQVEEMELSFSRGFSPGWLAGIDHKMLVPGLSSAKRGVLLGEVIRLHGDRVTVRLSSRVARGDGVVFEGDRASGEEQGGRVYEVSRRGRPVDSEAENGEVELAFDRRALQVDQLWVGQKVWKTDDPRLTQRLRKTYDAATPQRRCSLDLTVAASVGSPLVVEGRADSGATCRVQSEEPLEEAVKHPLTTELLEKQFGRLGATVYELKKLHATIQGRPMAPLSVLGKLRREIIAQLDASVARPAGRAVHHGALTSLRNEIDRGGSSSASPRLRVLVRSLDQLEVVLSDNQVAGVMVDFQDIRQYRQAVESANAAGMEIHLATPRIQKPGEMGVFHALSRHGADGMLVRNLAGLQFFVERNVPVVADFSLNVANELTAQWIYQQGAARLTASYDLNRDQLIDLLAATPSCWLEVVVHQHIPMFHNEHCVFCAVLSPGTDKTNCGRPCDHHEVNLRDRVGMEHPLTADVGCRNTLYNAMPQSAAEAVPELLDHGVRDFRVEFLRETPQAICATLSLYRRLLDGEARPKDVWRSLKAANRVGVTRGTLEQRRDPLAIL